MAIIAIILVFVCHVTYGDCKNDKIKQRTSYGDIKKDIKDITRIINILNDKFHQVEYRMDKVVDHLGDLEAKVTNRIDNVAGVSTMSPTASKVWRRT